MAVSRVSLNPAFVIFLTIFFFAGPLLAPAGSSDSRAPTLSSPGRPDPCLSDLFHAACSLIASRRHLWVAQATEPELPTPQAPSPIEMPEPSKPPEAPLPTSPLETERPKSEKPIDQLLLQRGAILLPKGILQVEPSFDYTRYSSDRVAISGVSIFEAIVIGTIRVDQVNRDIYTAALTGRYGILDRLQIEGRIPWVYRRDQELIGIGTPNERERDIDGSGLGDIEASLVGQAWIGREGVPDVLVRLRGRFPTGTNPFDIPTIIEDPGMDNTPRLTKAPTGNGYYSMAPGFTLVWKSDPVVFFGGFNYSVNFASNTDQFGEVNPGDNWELVLGVNLALSERVSVNLSFFDSQFNATTVNGRVQPGTSFNSGLLLLGTSVYFTPTSVLLVTVGAGVSQQSPDFQIFISTPTLFKLF